MKIVHKLRLLIILPIALAIIVALLLSAAGSRLLEARNQRLLAEQVVRAVFELDLLTYEYLHTYEYLQRGSPRIYQQWRATHTRLSRMLAAIEPVDGADRLTIALAVAELDLIHQVFESIVDTRRDAKPSTTAPAAQATESMQVGPLIASSQELVALATNLATRSAKAADTAIFRAAGLVLLLVMAAAGLLAFLSYVVSRSITRPLRQLHRGTQVVGAGDLKFKIGLDQPDELGQLSRAFDTMTEGLESVTVSRDELAAEVKERTRAELELRHTSTELAHRNDQMEADLNLARSIQLSLMRQQSGTASPDGAVDNRSVQFTFRYVPTQAVGGDFYDILALPEREVGVLLCDVMGHGMQAALVAAVLRGLVEKLQPVAADPGRFLAALNRDLMAVLQQGYSPILVTAFYVVADGKGPKIRYACAGHPAPFCIRRDVGGVTRLRQSKSETGPALGLMDDALYHTSHGDADEGDTIMLCTDGILDVNDGEGAYFEDTRMDDIITQRMALPDDALFDELIAEAKQFARLERFADDVCLVGVRFTESR